MIVRTPQGKFQVKSEDGHRLLGEYDTRAEAEARLAQVEYFKRQATRGKR